jgi:hypothetical protein
VLTRLELRTNPHDLPMKNYVKTMESVLAYIAAMPCDIPKAEVYAAHDITYQGKPLNPDVAEEMLFRAMLQHAYLLPGEHSSNEFGRTYRYVRRGGSDSDA